MSRCISCGIMITEETDICPLCRTVVQHDGKEAASCRNPYPDVRVKKRRFSVFMRILLALCILACAVCIFVNVKVHTAYPWSLLVTVIVLYAYGLFYLMARRDAGYRIRAFAGILGGAAATVIIDAGFGFLHWSFNYVLPGALLLWNLVLVVFMIINKRNWQSYLILQVGSIVLGCLPLIFIAVGLVTAPLLSEMAFVSGVLVFAVTFIIGGRSAKQELQRRFHV